jgi:hypothetical protein
VGSPGGYLVPTYFHAYSLGLTFIICTVWSQLSFSLKLHTPPHQTMPTAITLFDIQDDEPTMALPEVTSKHTANLSPKVKAPVQWTMHGKPSEIHYKSVTVPSFKRKNGSIVTSHNRQVQVKKPKAARKVTRNKKEKAPLKKRHGLKFHSWSDQESVSAAHSLHIQEIQNFFHPNRKV